MIQQSGSRDVGDKKSESRVSVWTCVFLSRTFPTPAADYVPEDQWGALRYAVRPWVPLRFNACISTLSALVIIKLTVS
jgi:hypothetical protein